MATTTKYAGDGVTGDAGIIWSAVIGGAFAAAGLTIILAPLGAAFGMATISPWHHLDADRTFTIAGSIWLILVQWLSSGLGGYLTGRMRTEWLDAHMHEVYFRDTVHGFLSWALVTVVTAAAVLFATVQAAGRTPPGTTHEIMATPLILYALAMFIGAFIAAVAGALGGAHRDLHFETGKLSD